MNTMNCSRITVTAHPTLLEQERSQQPKEGSSISSYIEKLSKMDGALEKNSIFSMRYYG